MRDVLKTYGPGFLLALSVGVLTALPNLVAVWDMGPAFRGIYPVNGSDDLYYLARHAEVLDGHVSLANPYLREHKDGPPAPFWIPDYLLAKGGEALGLGVGEAELLFDFLLPAALAFVSYAIFLALTGNVLLSAAGVVALHFGFFFEAFDRSPSPQFNFLFVLLLLYSTIAFVQTRSRSMLFLAVLSLAALFYVYTYYWTYAVILGGLWVASLALWARHDRKLLLELAGAVAGAGVLALPALISIVNSFSHPFYAESLARLGMIETHFPSGIAIVALCAAAAVFLTALYWRGIIERTPLSLLLLCAAAAPAIAVNQHLLTGKNLEFSSHYWDVAVFGAGFAIAYGIGAILARHAPGSRRFAGSVLILCALLFAAPSIYEVVGKNGVAAAEEYAWQEYAPVFSWLNANTEAEEVILSPSEELSAFIPIYTRNNVVYTRRANLHILSDREAQERFLASQYWSKVDEEFLREYERSVWGVHYINRFAHAQSQNKVRRLLGMPEKPVERFPQGEIEKVLSLSAEMRQEGLEAVLQKFNVSYVIFDARDAVPALPRGLLHKEASFGSFEVYSVR